MSIGMFLAILVVLWLLCLIGPNMTYLFILLMGLTLLAFLSTQKKGQ